jgi:beta-glucosidase-like glycosyl hydrolase
MKMLDKTVAGLAAGFAALALCASEADAKIEALRARAREIVGRMTLDEKISQLMNSSPAVPRLGIAPYDWWSEALHGVARNGKATVFPQPIGLAASFDEGLVREIGTAIGDEARVSTPARSLNPSSHGSAPPCGRVQYTFILESTRV